MEEDLLLHSGLSHFPPSARARLCGSSVCTAGAVACSNTVFVCPTVTVGLSQSWLQTLDYLPLFQSKDHYFYGIYCTVEILLSIMRCCRNAIQILQSENYSDEAQKNKTQPLQIHFIFCTSFKVQ